MPRHLPLEDLDAHVSASWKDAAALSIAVVMLAARHADREVSSLVEDDDIREMRLGLSYYYRRHNLKFQAAAGQIETELGTAAGVRVDRDVRLQAQFIF